MRSIRRRRGPAEVFAALGDETRLGLVGALARGGRRSIADLAKGRRMTRQGVTKHLRVLERVGVVRGVRVGRERLFELEGGAVMEMGEYLRAVSGEWDRAPGRLKHVVEERR